ncbi:sugar ABC transporter ATP-binding protein [Roseateles sp. BYS78W]|uniref:Sugar ABC transporter ATP-binding protein n=1 Tax=Pelomonas candidula TaxID=3299025 RepID=A0ABW7HAG6_9BURK
MLQLRGIAKRFGPTQALRGVDLDLRPGEVLALIGENGAGKSTLVKTLTGVHAPDAGEILLDGRPVRFARPQDAQGAGIAAVHQETVVFDELSAAENIFIGRPPTRRVAGLRAVDWGRMEREAQGWLDAVGATFAARTPARALSIAQRHQIEIARALAMQARVVIFDEPTAALSRAEIDDIYRLVLRLKSQGVSVLFISHKFDELFAVCDRYVVLRDGESVGAGDMASADEDELVRLMVGRAVEQIYPPRHRTPGEVALRVTGLSHPTEFAELSFEVRRGEVLAFYGLVGAGRTEAMLALMGLKPEATAKVEIGGHAVELRDPARAIAAGLAYVPEDRRGQGALLGFSVRENLTLPALAGPRHGWHGKLSRGPWLSARRERGFAKGLIDRLRIKAASDDVAVGSLSGGNQQKVVIAKWLGLHPRVVILDEPTKGIDIGAKQAVYGLIEDMVRQGLAVILVSSELPEAMHLADRVLVMRRGRIVAAFEHGAPAEAIVAAASGVAAPAEEVAA